MPGELLPASRGMYALPVRACREGWKLLFPHPTVEGCQALLFTCEPPLCAAQPPAHTQMLQPCSPGTTLPSRRVLSPSLPSLVRAPSAGVVRLHGAAAAPVPVSPCLYASPSFRGAGSSPFADGRPSSGSREEAALLVPACVQQPVSPRQPPSGVPARPMRPAPPGPAAELAWLLSQLPPSSPLAPPSCQHIVSCHAALPAPASPAQAVPPNLILPLLEPTAPLPAPPPLPTARTLLPASGALPGSGWVGSSVEAQGMGRCQVDEEVLSLIDW